MRKPLHTLSASHDLRVTTLAEMLTYCRPVDSPTEQVFCSRYIATLPGVWVDDCGNYHVVIGDSPVVWSCHTDTVHRTHGRQRLQLTPNTIALHPRAKSTCLGADDTVGVWILCEMIRARVPGHYVFHYGEEVGGIGSRAVVAKHPDYFADARMCIALDRAGVADVITHQAGDRCCSEAFAESLARALHAAGLAGYEPCATGVYTDSAEYTGIIPECTNLSVGYFGQHSAAEYVDTHHALTLLEALIALDVATLVIARIPAAPDRADVWADLDDDGIVWDDDETDDDGQPWASIGLTMDEWWELSDEDRRSFRRLLQL